MLKTRLIHPEILSILAESGHSSQILIADGNFPFHTTRGPNARVVYLNFMPGKLSVTDVLAGLISTVPIEAAAVMEPQKTGAYAMMDEPAIFNEFRTMFREAGSKVELEKIERFAFYDAVRVPQVSLIIATGEQRIYANLLLTIGVVMP